MDDLYGNLENYHDENIIDELKNENKELKTKLEEYSSAMTRLQKDFDKLNSEYKKLEMNYSSLLKTARAEIERKAEMIKSLNTEKDSLIIKTLQTSGRNNLNTRKLNNLNRNKSHKSETDSKTVTKLLPEAQTDCQNEKRHEQERINSTPKQSEEQILNFGDKSTFCRDKDIKDELNSKMGISKENIEQEIHKNRSMKIGGGKMSSRRKSMPFCSNIEPIFSSDDDLEAINLKHIRKSPLREDSQYYKHRSRDNFSSKDSSRYKTNRFLNQYKLDRYESSSKYTRHSPEYYRSKHSKDHTGSYKLRTDYKNSRKSSPHSDKYNRSKSRDRRIFEGERDYIDKHSPHNYDHSALKHKIRHDYNEPSNKRHKTNNYKDGLLEDKIFNDEKETEYVLNFTKQQDFIDSTSCQSPDYNNIENTIPQHTVKEIKHTSATPLEDPRVLCKKYVIKSNKGKTFLSTLVSEDIDIKPVDISLWNLQNEKDFMRPTLLTKQMSEEKGRDLVNMDTDKPSLNDSLESGEIQSLNNDNIHSRKDLHNDGDELCKDKNNTNKYKIPKLKKPVELCTGTKLEKFDHQANNQNTSSEKCDKSNVSQIKEHNISTSQIILNSNIVIDEQDTNKVITKTNITLPKNSVTAIRCSLADDLELSDETSESKDLHSDAKKAKKFYSKDKLSMNLLDLNQQKNDMPVVDDSIHRLNDKNQILCSKKANRDSSRDSSKIRKTKKKTELIDDSSEPKGQTKIQTLNKYKSKPVTSIQIKNKFSDLFGDSSSLITPDDLGIAPSDIQLPLTDKYVSIFDNTQDAVDLSVEDINKLQSNANKLTTFLTIREDQSIESNDKVDKEQAENDNERLVVQECSDKNANDLPKNETLEKDSQIVKTIVISTGVQPKYNSDSNLIQESQNYSVENIHEINNHEPPVINKINALATSTPQKIEHIIDTSSTISGHTVLNNANKDTDSISLSSNASNPDKILHETDVPDVRLFVKRRRKILKKPI